MFCTASTGLLKCLFSSGYSKLDAFSMMISKAYDDTINWSCASKEKLYDLTGKDGGPLILNDISGIMFTDGNNIMLEAPLTLTNLVSFFNGMFDIMMEKALEILSSFLVLILLMTCKSNARSSFQMTRSFLLIQKLSILLKIQMWHQFHRQPMIISVRVIIFHSHNCRA